MSEKAARAFALIEAAVGKERGTGEWMQITQELIDRFADLTHDHQFIHVDPERAKTTPFGTTIAHGFLTLSLLTHLGKGTNDPKADPARYDGMLMGVNYGFDRVRFVSPVKVGSRIRAHAELSRAKLEGNAIQMTRTFTVEIEGEAKPALVAEWITRVVYA